MKLIKIMKRLTNFYGKNAVIECGFYATRVMKGNNMPNADTTTATDELKA